MKEVTPEPCSVPAAWPLPLLAAAVLTLALACVPDMSGPVLYLATSLLAGLCVVALLDEAVRWRAGRSAAERALERAAWGLYFEEEPLAVLGGLRGLEMPGRAGVCLRIAARCLERAGRCRRLDRRMRREAARWVGRARREIGRGR